MACKKTCKKKLNKHLQNIIDLTKEMAAPYFDIFRSRNYVL